MAEWLEQASQWHEMYCHDLEVMSSNPGRVELGVLGISVLSRTWTKHIIKAPASKPGYHQDTCIHVKLIIIKALKNKYMQTRF